MKDLNGKVAVITGGAGGIGRAMGERFVQEGMKVVLADLKQGALDETVAEMRAQGADVIGVATDVSKLESVEALRDATLEHFGKVHVVCNNAGVASGAHFSIPVVLFCVGDRPVGHCCGSPLLSGKPSRLCELLTETLSPVNGFSTVLSFAKAFDRRTTSCTWLEVVPCTTPVKAVDSVGALSNRLPLLVELLVL